MNNYILPLILLLVAANFSGCKEDDNTSDIADEELDPSDYTEDLTAMDEFYKQNAIAYYAEFGIPSIVGAALIMEESGISKTKAFDGLLEHFDLNKFQQAIQQPQWSNEFLQILNQYQGLSEEMQWVEAMMEVGIQVRDLQLNNPNDPNLGSLYMMLGDGVNFALEDGFFQEMEFDSEVFNQDLNDDPLFRFSCVCDMLDDEDEYENNYCDGLDDDWPEEDITFKWSELTPQNRPRPEKTSKDGKCATLAAGLCLTKLNKIKDEVNEAIWLDLSEKLGAGTFRDGGVAIDKYHAYFKSQGFGVTILKDIPNGKTASEQAADQLKKGCDVKVHYQTPKGVRPGKAHIEYVHSIKVDKTNPQKATVTTNHWGDTNTFTYNSGNYSERSTGNLATNSWLTKPGRATYWVFCPKKD